MDLEERLNNIIYKLEEVNTEFNNIILLSSDLKNLSSNLDKFSE